MDQNETGDVQRATAQAAAAEAQQKRLGARPGAEPAWTVDDARRIDFARVEPGWPVISADGEELGSVHSKGRNYLVVPYGETDERTMFVPSEYIETVAGHRVILNQPSGLLFDMKLDAPPAGFAEEHERVSGVPHEPLRGEVESVPAVDPLTQGVAKRSAPPASQPAPLRAPDDTPRAAGSGTVTAIGGVQPGTPATPSDAALQPPQPIRDRGVAEAHVEATADGRAVSWAEGPGPRPGEPRLPAATHMDDSPAGWRGANERTGFVNAEDRAEALFEERSGYYVLSDSPPRDPVDGPTHQPGVKDPRSLEPLRTQFGDTGTPGDGQERNVTDLDLTRNKHPDGDPFGAQAATIGRPLAPGEPRAARRSLPGQAGSGRTRTGMKDVPPGSVMRPQA